MTGPIRDYEDLTGMQLTDAELDEFVRANGECVFNWTTKDGFPVGVVVAYIWNDGKFWTTCARRKRVRALKARPQTGIVINRGGCWVHKAANVINALPTLGPADSPTDAGRDP